MCRDTQFENRCSKLKELKCDVTQIVGCELARKCQLRKHKYKCKDQNYTFVQDLTSFNFNLFRVSILSGFGPRSQQVSTANNDETSIPNNIVFPKFCFICLKS